MGISIVWPSFWLTAAFFAACLVFVLQFFGIAKAEKAFCKNVLLNQGIISCLGLVLFGVIVVSTLCLLNRCAFCECGYFLYFVVLAFAVVITAVLVEGEITFSFFSYCCSTASLVGLGFMVCYHFSYMWYMLGFLVLSIILLVWRSFVSTHEYTEEKRKSFDEDDL
ncbi:MAG: hypothetical protein J6C85_05795 [Alphaproteobacteria bacterium]|nr:hypothetical protein [Alphaproteobacteria bacterium]